MKIETLTINDHQEVVVKITKEVLNLFKIEVAGPCFDADFAQLSVVHRKLPPLAKAQGGNGCVRAETLLYAYHPDGTESCYREAGRARRA